MRLATTITTVSCSIVTATAAAVADSQYINSDSIISRDVAIVGGGQSGTYAAINLRKMGKSVVVIEKENVLGGHVNTYIDPSTGAAVDYGVQGFLNNTETLDFFAHFNVALGSENPADIMLSSRDFNTGRPVNFTLDFNLTAWANQLAKYPWLDTTWKVPQPVASDLLLPLSEFITKYNLQDIGYSLYYAAQGLSNPLQQPVVNVMKMVDPTFLSELYNGRGLATVNQNNGEIYVKALAELGVDALLSSTVTSAVRNDSGVNLVVSTPNGCKRVQASKLLVTIPPTAENMKPFALDSIEGNLFNQFSYMGYYTLLLNNTGLPNDTQPINSNSSAATYHIPQLPGASQITPTRIPGLFYAWYRSPTALSQKIIEQSVIAEIQALQKALGLASTKPGIVEFRSHTPYKLYVSAEAIGNGFYTNLYNLQGHHNTWYTGAAFVSHNCGLIWAFTQALLQKLVS